MNRFAPYLLGSLFLLPGLAWAQASLLVGNKSDDTVWRISLEDGSRVEVVDSGPGPHEIAVAADGRSAVVTDYGHQQPGSSLTVLDLAGGGAARSIDLGRHGRPHGLRCLPDGQVLVTSRAALRCCGWTSGRARWPRRSMSATASATWSRSRATAPSPT